MDDDIVKEKEDIVKRIRKKHKVAQQKYDQWDTSDWPCTVSIFLVLGAIGSYFDSIRIGVAVLIFLGVSFPVVKILEKRSKVKFDRLDRELEDARIDLARIKKRIG